MAKEKKLSAEELALKAKAEAFKVKMGFSQYGQAEHAAFILSLAREAGLPKEGATAFYNQLRTAGCGGNLSQMAQAFGWRQEKAKVDVDAMLAAME